MIIGLPDQSRSARIGGKAPECNGNFAASDVAWEVCTSGRRSRRNGGKRNVFLNKSFQSKQKMKIGASGCLWRGAGPAGGRLSARPGDPEHLHPILREDACVG